MWFTRVSINHPVFATMVMAAFLVLGLFSYHRLPVEQFPNVEFPVVVVSTAWPGAAPEVVESDITRRIEEQVNTISGVYELSSRSFEGNSVVIVRFDLTVDPAQATQDVREKIALVRPQLREDVKESLVTRFNPDDMPVVSLAIRSPRRNARELTTLADQVVKRRLENVRGVGRVTLVGGVRREVQVALRPADMEALRVGVDQVMQALASENQELPAGTLVARDREQVVQIRARMASVAEFGRIIVARRGGHPVYLSQVADVIDGEEEPDTSALVDGERAIALDVVRAQGENTIAVVDNVRRTVERLAAELPPDVSVSVVRDASTAIRNSVASVQRNIVEGALLTVVIVFLFLSSWRSTVITGLTLPISLIGSFLVMFAMGFSINMVTLLALSICVGLLIDDAIVVRENIVRHQAMGKHHRDAAFDGTKEIGLAVAATTFTIVAVFMPIGFMGGIIGRFFRQFGVTVAFAVMLSMLVAFTLDPMLSSVWRDPDAHGPRGNGPVARLLRAFQAAMLRLEAGYVALLRWGLRHRAATMAAAVAIFAGAFPLMKWVGIEFVPEADNNEIYVQFYTPVGSSLQFTEDKLRQVEAALHEFDGVTMAYGTINTGIAQGRNYATVFAVLLDRSRRPLSVQEMRTPVRERLARIAGITVTDLGNLNAVSSGKPIQISIQGQDTAVLDRLAAQVRQAVADVNARLGRDGIVELDTSSKPAKPTVSADIDRALASDLGVGVAQVSAVLRPLLAGDATTTWRAPDDENYDVRVRLPRSARSSVADLERLTLASARADADGGPRMVALRQIAAFHQGLGPTQINRKALTREILISANVEGIAAGSAGTLLQQRLARIDLPPGYRFETGGSNRDMAESFGYALQALVLAVLFIYMILASQFGSFLQPVAIMASLPLSLIGVVLALLAWRSTLNMFSMIGFIMLMGLVTKNAILLVDFANQARARGLDRAQALLQAAEIRLRPILMTTLAMVFGMLPLAIGAGEGAEQRAPLAHAVIGGVLASTLLTLLVVPVLYTFLDDLGARFTGRARQPAGDPVAATPTGAATALAADPAAGEPATNAPVHRPRERGDC
ncbi:MAG: efflux RND transporter permease subunit [Burkholderiaceae bacterium]|nr:efflux RND transporter permease subunit [Burkholderiaceae bacterium]